MEFTNQSLLNSLFKEVEKLIELVNIKDEEIKKLEEELSLKTEQLAYLKVELKELIQKVENFNSLFNELPLYNGVKQEIGKDITDIEKI